MTQVSLRLRLVGRCILALTLIALVGLAIGFLVTDFGWGLVTGGVLCVTMTVLGFFSKTILAYWLQADAELPRGMKQTLKRLLDEKRIGIIPRISIYQSPVPRALVARSLAGSPTLFLSWAALAILDESELRAVIEVGTRKAREPGLAFRTLNVCVATALLRATPRAWIGFFERFSSEPFGFKTALGPGSAAFFLVVFPVVRLFLWMGRPWSVQSDAKTADGWALGLRKIAQTAHFTHVSKDPALEMLQFFGLPSGTALLAGLMSAEANLSQLVSAPN